MSWKYFLEPWVSEVRRRIRRTEWNNVEGGHWSLNLENLEKWGNLKMVREESGSSLLGKVLHIKHTCHSYESMYDYEYRYCCKGGYSINIHLKSRGIWLWLCVGEWRVVYVLCVGEWRVVNVLRVGEWRVVYVLRVGEWRVMNVLRVGEWRVANVLRVGEWRVAYVCLLYTSPSPRD